MLKQTKLKPTKFVVSQEEILDALHKKDAKSLKVLCNQLGVSCTGSTEDVVNNLHELCLFKDIYPKLFKRIKKCGGGVVHFRCPHGVCYYFKTLLRHESARDYIDGLLSFKVQPTVFVSDIAAQVAHHGENRKQGMFGPNKGMLYEWNEQNIEKSNNGELLPTEIEFQDTTAHYSLFDKFHMFSKKKGPEKSFRSIGNCVNLHFLNSSAAEQANSIMAKDRHFMYTMNFANFAFYTRLSIHLQNKALNNKFVNKTKQLFDVPVKRNEIGIGVLSFQGQHFNWMAYMPFPCLL
ncbi:uncharacterized protein LOC144746958 isoform X2 [Ciona intestinalis]